MFIECVFIDIFFYRRCLFKKHVCNECLQKNIASQERGLKFFVTFGHSFFCDVAFRRTKKSQSPWAQTRPGGIHDTKFMDRSNFGRKPTVGW